MITTSGAKRSHAGRASHRHQQQSHRRARAAFRDALASGASRVVRLDAVGNLPQQGFSPVRHDSMAPDQAETIVDELEAALAQNKGWDGGVCVMLAHSQQQQASDIAL
jgi:hypothetical protein